MKYQEIIVGRQPAADEYNFRRFAMPVSVQDGRWLPSGPMREETHRFTKMAMMLSAAEYDEATSDCGSLADIDAADRWEVFARLWLPDDYVPESDEVMRHSEREAIKHALERGLITEEWARRRLENADA
jgi:hypothetical protein